MRRIAVLASGRGSNLQVLLDAIADGRLNGEIVGVFSDRTKAGALQRALDAGVPAFALKPRDFESRLAFDQALFSLVDSVQPDLIVCAGYMRLLNANVVEARPGRMINIHPSLLPDFKGLHTHQQALDAGARVHGASVHVVTAELDGGPVIAQARVRVETGDDAESLAARVLEREHPLLLATVDALLQNRITLTGERPGFDGVPMLSPLQLGDDGALHVQAH